MFSNIRHVYQYNLCKNIVLVKSINTKIIPNRILSTKSKLTFQKKNSDKGISPFGWCLLVRFLNYIYSDLIILILTFCTLLLLFYILIFNSLIQ